MSFKKLCALTLALTLLLSVMSVSTFSKSAYAVDAERDDITIESPTATPGQATSGYADKNGKPLSYEEFQKISEENSKPIWERNPAGTVLGLAIVGGIGVGVWFLIRKLKHGKAPQQYPQTPAQPMQPMAPQASAYPTQNAAVPSIPLAPPSSVPAPTVPNHVMQPQGSAQPADPNGVVDTPNQ